MKILNRNIDKDYRIPISRPVAITENAWEVPYDNQISWEEFDNRLYKYSVRSRGEMGNVGLFVIPGVPANAKNKKVFKVIKENVADQEHTLSPLPIQTRTAELESFTVTSEYLVNKTLPFIPHLIKEYDLSWLFTTEVQQKMESWETWETTKAAVYSLDTTPSQEFITKISEDTISVGSTHLNTNKITQTEESKMSKVNTVVSKVKDSNLRAAKSTARIAGGKAMNAVVYKKVVPHLPIMVRGYADTSLGKVVIANIIATALTTYDSNNAKLALVSEAMIESAMFDLMSTFDIEEMVSSLLDSKEAKRVMEAFEEEVTKEA